MEKVRQNEDEIRRAMVNAQKEERKVIDEANDRADLILRTAKMNTEKILAEFKEKIREERMTLYKLRRAVREFKENSLKQYKLHLEFLNQISPDPPGDDPDLKLTEDDYANSLLLQMRLDLENSAKESDEEEEEARNAPVRRGGGADFPEDRKMRTAIYETVKKNGPKPSKTDTKEVPRSAASAASAATKEMPPIKKKKKEE